MVNWWVLVLVAIGKPVAPERRGCSAVYSRYTLSHTHTRTHARRQPGSSRCVGLVCVCARWWYERRVVRGLYTIVNPISTHARVVPPRCLLQCQHQHRRFHHLARPTRCTHAASAVASRAELVAWLLLSSEALLERLLVLVGEFVVAEPEPA